ncbi:MAG: chlorophyllase/cutinase-like alpha/beta fold protein [Polyangiaceae bacterium]
MRRTALACSLVALCSCASGGTSSIATGGTAPGEGGNAAGPDGAAPTSPVVDEDAASNTPPPPPGSGDDAATAEDAGENADDAPAGSATDATTGSLGPYGSNGPYTVTTATFSVPSPNGTFTTTAYIPSAPGPDPAVILSSGFFQDGDAYAPYANRLASWGIVTFLRDDPNLGESTANIVSDVSYEVTTWLATTNGDSTSAVYGKIDVSKIGLAGHSRGGQIALLAGEGLVGKIQGVFGLDPVDTTTAPEASTSIAAIGVPLAFIGETTDNASSGCAPADVDFLTLYGDASSPAVAITALNADHTMFEDPADCSFCTLCTAGTASQPTVLATAVRYLTAYFARQLLGDATVGATFAGAGINQDVAAGIVTVVSK